MPLQFPVSGFPNIQHLMQKKAGREPAFSDGYFFAEASVVEVFLPIPDAS